MTIDHGVITMLIMNTVLLTLVYAYGGMRLLMLIDDLSDGAAMQWAHASEWRAWLALVFWPVPVTLGLRYLAVIEKSGTGGPA